VHCDRLQPINLGGQTNGSASVRRQIDVTGSCTRTSQVDPAGERGRHHLDCGAIGAMACCGRALPIHTAWANLAPPPTRNAEAVGSIRRWTAASCVAKPPTCLAGYEAVAERNCGPGVLTSRNMRSGRLGRHEQDGRNRATDPNLDPAGPEWSLHEASQIDRCRPHSTCPQLTANETPTYESRQARFARRG